MADVVRKEHPVLIENVSLVINVYNVGQHGDVSSFQLADHINGQQPLGLLTQNGLGHSSATTSNFSSTDASSLQKPLGGPESVVNAKEQFPLGWIAFLNGDVIPFGVQQTAIEITSFGDRRSWKEIRVCLPPCLLADETDFYCPVSSCREKLPKHRSIETHIKKHLGFTDKECQVPVNSNSQEGSLPCPLFYYCQDKNCQYYGGTAEKSFKAYKNVKQHYLKVHAPRLFECEQCQKTFSTQKVLETHKLMCGEKYSCSTCDLSYKTLEVLQTHCRRKGHNYDHNKYKDKRNSVKQEMQSLKGHASPAFSTIPSTGTGRKSKSTRKLHTLLPKPASTEVFNTIQAFCQQAGVKVDLGCQTVCTAFIQKSEPIEAVVAPSTPCFTHKKRKSTDTQTNIVKFRATCLDQKNNATNTNFDWKKVITSDSQTQTADTCDSMELKTAIDSSAHFNDVFATFKISETSSEACTEPTSDVSTAAVVETSFSELPFDHTCGFKQEVLNPSSNFMDISDLENSSSSSGSSSKLSTKATPLFKVTNGPSLTEEFISFLEAIDSSTQTDPEMFDAFGSSDFFGISDLFEEDLTGARETHYVSVSSTASQTAVERVATRSLSAEDYEVLLNTTDNTKIKDLNAFSDYIKIVEAANGLGNFDLFTEGEGSEELPTPQLGNDFCFDWEHIVEEVYRGAGN